MREYQPRTVQELAACTCDRCKRRMTPEDGEWQERLAFDHTCGFDSIFGDGNTVSLDLCQHCAREVLGQWLRITPHDEPTKPVSWAEYLASGPRATSDFMAEGRGEHEQAEKGNPKT
nr:hypothetical protein [Ralstonia solanacearum]